MRTLYLHVGWSKTGTSAIQKQIHLQDQDFKDKGILYPKSLQWGDHAHHLFALAFQGKGVYSSPFSVQEALQKLQEEINDTNIQNVLLSSELSPFYFDNPLFTAFVEKHFDQVKVIFTLRRQSELLLSLFNQLVKDPNVRYPASLFTLAFQNIGNLNFYHKIDKWAKVVGKNNVILLTYDKEIVKKFLLNFDIKIDSTKDVASESVNESIPNRCLPLIQKHCAGIQNNSQYLKIRNTIIEKANAISEKTDLYSLFSINEQQAVDLFYTHSNRLLQQSYFNNQELFQPKTYKEVKAIDPNLKLEITDVQLDSNLEKSHDKGTNNE